MRKLALTCLLSGIVSFNGFAQTLFTYGGKPVTKEEFLRVYQKNALNKQPDFSEAALREYLDLYSLFRMKVAEAELQHLDTLTSIQSELTNYRKQLAKTYLTDEEVSNRMIREAYDRMKEEVHVAHILIMSPMGQDTAVAYRKIDSIYKEATKKGGDFAALARQFTEDKSSKEGGGDIGFITALQTIYPVENAAYNTPVGKISAPFRTQFGYHIVKVIEKRPSRGEVKVAHILIATPKSKGDEGIALAQRKMDAIKAELKKGVAFETLVKQYSEDKYTNNDGGVLPQFGAGKMVPAFENAAFALKKPGDVSEPLKTDYGFHIIKLIDKYPLKPFDSLQAQIKRKVENDSRAQTAKDQYLEKIKAKSNFKEYRDNLEAVYAKVAAIPDTGKMANTFKAADFKSMNQPVFELAGRKYLQSDLMNYAEGLSRGRLNGPKRAVMADIYKNYVNTIVNDWQEQRLVEENKDFRNLMEEYRAGIMLFELMDRNVWGKASKDTVGLKAFYENNKSKYMWEPGFSGAVYKFKDEEAMKEGKKLLADKNMKEEDIVKQLNSESKPDAVTVQRGRFEFRNFKDVPQAELTKGKVTSGVKTSDGKLTVVKVDEVYNQPTNKSLDEARGYVVAEYQDYLEKKWNEQMRKKYPMKVEEGTFNGMVKK
jgi:peptidyl-prolyl cis-trans isomerase SurA